MFGLNTMNQRFLLPHPMPLKRVAGPTFTTAALGASFTGARQLSFDTTRLKTIRRDQ
jgi:hypothetical protein